MPRGGLGGALQPGSTDETGSLTESMQESMLPDAGMASAPHDIESGAQVGNSAGELVREARLLTLSDITAPEAIYRRTSPQCAPCGLGRCGASIGAVLVPGLVGLTLIPFVFKHPYLPAPWAIADVAVFLILVALLLTAWLHTVFVDPGTTPFEWHQHISRSPASVREQYRLCPKTNTYRPPRSHFDSITRRVVLNMDHFCPWVCNTVGYFNRKFFILFLCYTVLTTAYAVVSTYFWHDLNLSAAQEENGMLAMSLVLNCTLCVTVTGFGAFHVKMAFTNETTIEPGRGFLAGRSQYNVGWRKNWESVMGENPWLWLLPVYGSGPSGDGVHWPIDEVAARQRLDEAERSQQILAVAQRTAERRESAALSVGPGTVGTSEDRTGAVDPFPLSANEDTRHLQEQPYGVVSPPSVPLD